MAGHFGKIRRPMSQRIGLFEVENAELPGLECGSFRVLYDERAPGAVERFVVIRHGAFWPCGARRWFCISPHACRQCGVHDGYLQKPEIKTARYQVACVQIRRDPNELIVLLREPQNFSYGAGPTTETRKFVLKVNSGQVGHWHKERLPEPGKFPEPAPIQWYNEPEKEDNLRAPRFIRFESGDGTPVPFNAGWV